MVLVAQLRCLTFDYLCIWFPLFSLCPLWLNFCVFPGCPGGSYQMIDAADYEFMGRALQLPQGGPAGAVRTGIGTVRDDDPQLTVRAVDTPRQPRRVVVDSRLETPLTARILAGGGALIGCAIENAAKIAQLREQGAGGIVIPNAAGKVELPALMQELGRREINELHVEAGCKLNGSLINEGCVDELLLYFAPCLIGDPARGMADFPELADLGDRRALRIGETRMGGGELRIIARLGAREKVHGP